MPKAKKPAGGETLNSDDLKTKALKEGVTLTLSQATGSPQVIGNYRIIQRLGEGGMGEVYEAEQTKPIRRRVALKLIKWGMDTREVVARFESERQALALMNNPNIARVYDAGATEQGRPYFVMECVKGVPITKYCDTHRLNTEERLELFVQVCNGVQHAHQKGIIHRDIKASNILVTIQDDKPIPKIIDFGVAKATEQRLTELTVFTEFGQFIGTPEYMSPEQAEMTGLDIDTRTDVYSLGVLLYELLVGRLPFETRDLRQAGFDEIRRKIREDEPPKPSTRLHTLVKDSKVFAEKRRTDAPTLLRQLKGDLDWITMMAMAKDRTKRYASASELATDINRYLRNEPVTARPPSAAYRIGKYIRRHKTGVAAAGLVVLAMLAGITGTTIGLVKAKRAERTATSEARTAQEVSDFLVTLFEVSDPGEARGNTITAREILDRGAERIESELQGQPLIQARLMETISATYEQLGLFDPALANAEIALAIREKELGSEHKDVARSLQSLGSLYIRTADNFKAEELLTRALAIREKTLGPEHEAVARTLGSLASLYRDQGKYPEAEPLLKRSLDIKEKTLGPDHLDMAIGFSNLAVLYRRMGKYPEAERYFKRALAIREKKLEPDHPDLARTLNSLAILYVQQQKFAEAEPLFQRTLEIKEKTLGPDHPDVANSLNNLAILHIRQQKFDDVEALFQRTLKIREKAYGNDHPQVAASLGNLASFYMDQGKYEQAEPILKRSLAIKESRLKPDHPEIAKGYITLAILYKNQKKFKESGPLYQRALAIQEKVLGPEHPELASNLFSFGEYYWIQERYAEALPIMERVLAIREKILEPDHGDLAESLGAVALIYARLGRNSEAEAFFIRAIAAFDKSLGQEDPLVLYFQACYWAVLGESEKALPFLRKALDAGFSHPFADDPALKSLRQDPEFQALIEKDQTTAA